MTHFILSTVKWKYHKPAKSKDKNYLVGERPKIKLTIFQWNFPIWIKQKLFSFFLDTDNCTPFLFPWGVLEWNSVILWKSFLLLTLTTSLFLTGDVRLLCICTLYGISQKNLGICIFTFTFLIAVRREHCNTLDVYGFSCTANLFSWNQHAKDWHCHNNFIKKQNWRKKFVNLFCR